MHAHNVQMKSESAREREGGEREREGQREGDREREGREGEREREREREREKERSWLDNRNHWFFWFFFLICLCLKNLLVCWVYIFQCIHVCVCGGWGWEVVLVGGGVCARERTPEHACATRHICPTWCIVYTVFISNVFVRPVWLQVFTSSWMILFYYDVLPASRHRAWVKDAGVIAITQVTEFLLTLLWTTSSWEEINLIKLFLDMGRATPALLRRCQAQLPLFIVAVSLHNVQTPGLVTRPVPSVC